VIQCSRPEYSKEKRSQATGTVTIPGYWSMTASIWVARSALATSNAAPNDQMATASIRRANDFAPTYERFRHPVAARMSVIHPQVKKGMKYGEYCQIIRMLPGIRYQSLPAYRTCRKTGRPEERSLRFCLCPAYE